ncbi:hypothetical protein [Brevibacillus sp. H7]|uniref:hypothetical protein n=1 Tax=Brevibacillus sp. H7 TaxID=3349138 RepID=UPI003822EAD3
MSKMITWERAFVRMGFVFEKEDDSFRFLRENPENLRLLEVMLRYLGVKDHFQGSTFTPPTSEVEEDQFITAFYEGRGARDDFPGEVESVILHALDPYIAGIVRWCSAIGIKTAMSCDGHGKRYPILHFHRGEQHYATILDSCLALLSNGRWQFKYNHQAAGGRLMIRHSSVEMRESAKLRESRFEQDWLLDMAEALYRNQDVLRDLVQTMNAVMKTNS